MKQKPSDNQYIFGLRAIIEAIDAGRPIDRLMVRNNLTGDLAAILLAKAHDAGINTQRVPQQRLDRITRSNHQGAIALLAAVTYYDFDSLLNEVTAKGENPLLLMLDGITDVRNFGALARTADCAGVNAIILPATNSVSVTADAVKTSAGALNYLPVCRVQSLPDAARALTQAGIKVVATSARKNAIAYTACNFTGPVAVVLGAEDRGISPEMLRASQECVAIPEFGQINSLNVSVAGGIVLYEAVRQRLAELQEVL